MSSDGYYDDEEPHKGQDPDDALVRQAARQEACNRTKRTGGRPMKPMTEEHRQKIKKAMLDRWKAKKDEQPQDNQEIGQVTSVSVLLTAQDRKVRQFIHDMNRLTDKEMNARYGSYWTKIADFLGLL